MIKVHKCNILVMDFNGDCYGIVYCYQIVMDVNVNILNDKMDNLDVLLIVCCIIVLIMIGYQIKLKKLSIYLIILLL